MHEIRNMMENIDRLEEPNGQTADIAALTARINELEATLKESSKENASLHEIKDMMESIISELSEKVDRLEEPNGQTADTATLTAGIDELETTLKELSTENASLHEIMESIISEFEGQNEKRKEITCNPRACA